MENGKQPINPLANYCMDREKGEFKFGGLTKLEYFSAMAMNGLMFKFSEDGHELDHCENVVRKAIRMADELLKQLEK